MTEKNIGGDFPPHMCQDGHPPIRHWDSENEQCPLCRALNGISEGLQVQANQAIALEKADRALTDYKRLEAICESRSDVLDGDEGRQLPNEAMSILMEWRSPV